MGNEEGDSSGDELVEVDALEESDDDFAYEEIDIDEDDPLLLAEEDDFDSDDEPIGLVAGPSV